MILSNLTIITQNNTRSIIERGFIEIEKSLIKRVGKMSNLKKGVRTRDMGGAIALPGLLNAHWHLGESIYRGHLRPGMSLEKYLGFTEHLNTRLKIEERGRALIADYSLISSLSSGTTTVAGGRIFPTNESLGVLAVSGFMLMNSNKLREYAKIFMQKFADEVNKQNSQMTRPAVFIHSLNFVDENQLAQVTEVVRKNRVKIMIHLAETKKSEDAVKRKYGMSSVRILDKYGLLGPDTMLIHCVHVSKSDLRLISQRGAGVVLCLSSNLHVGDALPDLKNMKKLKIRMALATDGIATSGTLDMLEEARRVLLVCNQFQKETLTGQHVLDMITRIPAEFLGLTRTRGSIESGKEANILLLKPVPKPAINNDLAWNILFYYQPQDVCAVISNGHFVVSRGRLMAPFEKRLERSKKFLVEVYGQST